MEPTAANPQKQDGQPKLLWGERTNEEELTEILLDSTNTLLKFTENDQILACVLLTAKENQLYLGMLTVSPQLQNGGIGAQLLAQLIYMQNNLVF
jgi:N-acetylglutamate synthase-like GNAT family acetyltransferase